MKSPNLNRSHNSFFKTQTCLACFAWLALSGGSAQAATTSWTNNVGGDYTNAVNWGGTVPGTNDTASFGIDKAYTVNVTAPAVTNFNMRFNAANGGPVNFNLGTNTLTLTDDSALSVSCLGYSSWQNGQHTNTVIINGGTVMIPSGPGNYNGVCLSSFSAGGVSTLILSNAVFNALNQLVGAERFGNASGNGSLVVAGGTNITRAIMNIGSTGNGSVILDGNAMMVVTSYVNVGTGPNATGTITVSSGAFYAGSGIYLGKSDNTAKGVLNLLGGTTTVNSAVLSTTYGGSGAILVNGPNTMLVVTNGGVINLGSPIAYPSQMVISNGIVLCYGGINIANGSNLKGTLLINGGTLNGFSSGVYVGGSGASTNSFGNVVVSGTGVLEANNITVYTNSPSAVTNNGGIFQYTSATPTIIPGTFGTVVITNGAISFKNINNADVFCNQSTKPLDSTNKIAYFGTNTFRLNNATNSGTIDQTYTFAPGIATNFARLELLNGSTYRNGNVTIAAGGSLYLSSGASTISSVLTAAPSSTIEFDLTNTNAPGCLLSTTNMYLNGCTLQLDLANPPIINTQFMIISNSLASQLSYAFSGSSTKQSFTLNRTNYLTSIALSGGGTEVLVRTTIVAYGTSVFFH